jgi:hypothetical protein
MFPSPKYSLLRSVELFATHVSINIASLRDELSKLINTQLPHYLSGSSALLVSR